MRTLDKILGIIVMLISLTMAVFAIWFYLEEDILIIRLACLYLALFISLIIAVIGIELVFTKKKENKSLTLKECSNCRKQHTMDCPNSAECYATEDKPYFERKDKSESDENN